MKLVPIRNISGTGKNYHIAMSDLDNLAINMSTESPLPAMRAASLIDFNCSIRLNDGTWQHFDAGQRGGGYQHVESDGGYAAREAEAMWGGL